MSWGPATVFIHRRLNLDGSKYREEGEGNGFQSSWDDNDEESDFEVSDSAVVAVVATSSSSSSSSGFSFSAMYFIPWHAIGCTLVVAVQGAVVLVGGVVIVALRNFPMVSIVAVEIVMVYCMIKALFY